MALYVESERRAAPSTSCDPRFQAGWMADDRASALFVRLDSYGHSVALEIETFETHCSRFYPHGQPAGLRGAGDRREGDHPVALGPMGSRSSPIFLVEKLAPHKNAERRRCSRAC